VAENAAWLHRLTCPGCDTIHAYRCECGEWHIGHKTPEDAERCRHWLSGRPRPDV